MPVVNPVANLLHLMPHLDFFGFRGYGIPCSVPRDLSDISDVLYSRRRAVPYRLIAERQVPYHSDPQG